MSTNDQYTVHAMSRSISDLWSGGVLALPPASRCHSEWRYRKTKPVLTRAKKCQQILNYSLAKKVMAPCLFFNSSFLLICGWCLRIMHKQNTLFQYHILFLFAILLKLITNLLTCHLSKPEGNSQIIPQSIQEYLSAASFTMAAISVGKPN